MSPAFYSDNTSGSAWLGTRRYHSAARRARNLSSPFLAGELSKQQNKYAHKSTQSDSRSHASSSYDQDSRIPRHESRASQNESQKVTVADIRAQLSKESYFSGGFTDLIQEIDKKKQQAPVKNPKKKSGQNSKNKGKKDEGSGCFNVVFWIVVFVIFAYFKFL